MSRFGLVSLLGLLVFSRYNHGELFVGNIAGWSSPVARQAWDMDTKLKADIAESAVVTELLKRGFRVLKPVGDRLPYDLALDLSERLCRIQVKAALFDRRKELYAVDARRTKTNRRVMRRAKYGDGDFDFAILYLEDRSTYYVMPSEIFNDYGSTISLVEEDKRQRKPRSADYRERWDLLSIWAAQPVTAEARPVKVGEPSAGDSGRTRGNPEPSPR